MENGTLVDNSKNSVEPTITKPVETIIKKEEKPVEIKQTKAEVKVGNEKATEIKTTKPAEKIEEKPFEKKPAVAKVTETKEIAIQTMEEDAFLPQTTISKFKAAEVIIQKPKANNAEPNWKAAEVIIQKPKANNVNAEPSWDDEPNLKSHNEKTKVETTHYNQNNNVTQKGNTTVVTPTPKQEKEQNNKVETTQKNEGKDKVQEKKKEQKKTENENIQTQEDPSWGNEEIIPSDNVKIIVVV